MTVTVFRRHALRIARDNAGITGQAFAALVWPNGRMHPQGLARKGAGLLVRLQAEGLIRRQSDGWREYVGELTMAGRRALEDNARPDPDGSP